jgi:hypothetical protein
MDRRFLRKASLGLVGAMLLLVLSGTSAFALVQVNSVSPSFLGQGATNQSLTISGGLFLSGATVQFSNPGIHQIGSPTVNLSTIVVNVSVDPSAGSGPGDVTVDNSGDTSTCTSCFTVDPKPMVTGESPAGLAQGATDQIVTLTGTDFAPSDMTVAVSGTGVTVGAVNVGSPTSLTVHLTVSPSAPTGERDLTLTNPDHGISTCTSCFTINAPPTASITPPSSLTGGAIVTFSQDVHGVDGDNVLFRLTGTTTDVPNTHTCTDSVGAATSCSGATVGAVTLTPASPLVSGQHYTISVAPNGAPPIAESDGVAVTPETAAFRASRTEQETSAGATYAWRTETNANAFGGSYSIEHLAGARGTFPFLGTSVTWYTNTGPNYGYAYVFIDGVYRGAFNQIASSVHYRVARTFSHLAAGQHTIAIVVHGTKGGSKGTGTDIAIDAFAVNGSTLATSPVTFAWRKVGTIFASGGGYADADRHGAQVLFTFRGTRIDWYTTLGTARGKANVYIDGVFKGTFDNFASSTTYGYARAFKGLTDSVHTIRILVLGTHRAGATGSLVSVEQWIVF